MNKIFYAYNRNEKSVFSHYEFNELDILGALEDIGSILDVTNLHKESKRIYRSLEEKGACHVLVAPFKTYLFVVSGQENVKIISEDERNGIKSYIRERKLESLIDD